MRLVVVLCLGASLQVVEAQAKSDGPDVYGARNTFGVMAEYSNDSSHIIMGSAENVKLGAAGLQYQRRLIANHFLVWSYAAEFRPVILESIPTETATYSQTSPSPITFVNGPSLTARCIAGTTNYVSTVGKPPITYVATNTITCGRQMNYAQGLSPFGMRVNLRPGHRLQPTISTLEGYIFSTKALPISSAGSFNFSFEIGTGLEYYLARHRSVRLEYQVQHYSNKDTADANPGVDNGLFKLTYSFGR